MTKVFYTCEKNAETFSARTVAEAVEEYLDAVASPLPRTVTVYRYQSREVDTGGMESDVVDRIVEMLDDEYSISGSGYEPTPEQRGEHLDKARELIDAIVSCFEAESCDPDGEETVDVLHWIKLHRPDWLEMRNGRIQCEVEK